MHSPEATARPLDLPPEDAPPDPAADPSAEELRQHLEELAAALVATPMEGRVPLRARVQEAQWAMRTAGADDGLLALLLRNLLRDLARSPSRFEAAYFADQLRRMLARLG